MSRARCPECQCQCRYGDQPLQLRPQKPRTTFTHEQLGILEIAFKENCYPGAKKRSLLAQATGLPVDRVRVWFQNRRAKEKRLREDELAMSANFEGQKLNRAEIYNNPFEQQNFFAPAARIHPVCAESPPKSEEEIIRVLLKRAKEKDEARRKEQLRNGQVLGFEPERKKKIKKQKFQA